MNAITTISAILSILISGSLYPMDLDTKKDSKTTQSYKKLSQKKWVCASPYENSKCTDCRQVTCIGFCGIGGLGCASVKGCAWCCNTFCSSVPVRCSDACSASTCRDLWFPLGKDNCEYAGDACCSLVSWVITISTLASPVIGLLSFSPCCNEDGPFCCLEQVDITSNENNRALSESTELIENNN